MKIIDDVVQGSIEWYELRAGKLTGTRFAKVMSKNTTKGYQDLITDLTGEIINEAREEGFSTHWMERGIEV